MKKQESKGPVPLGGWGFLSFLPQKLVFSSYDLGVKLCYNEHGLD
jgi:hypothetical protein